MKKIKTSAIILALTSIFICSCSEKDSPEPTTENIVRQSGMRFQKNDIDEHNFNNTLDNSKEEKYNNKTLENTDNEKEQDYINIDKHNYLCFTAEQKGSTIELYSHDYDVYLEYSTDKKEWFTYNIKEKLTLENIGDKIYFRGDNPLGLYPNVDFTTTTGYHGKTFLLTGKIAASGNIMSLISKECDVLEIPQEKCFEGLFDETKDVLTQAPELPATKLKPSCYSSMFRGCISLKKSPKLPAEILEPLCYDSMFYGCTSLTEIQEISAKKLADQCCIYMFKGCSSLVNAPKLYATEVVEDCYRDMFKDCKSLISAPELLAENIESSCYNSMFYGCTNLKTIKVHFSQWKSSENIRVTSSWVENVANSGIFICPKSLDIQKRGDDYIPEGWTIKTF